jgi:hypothetical protein
MTWLLAGLGLVLIVLVFFAVLVQRFATQQERMHDLPPLGKPDYYRDHVAAERRKALRILQKRKEHY